MAKAWRLVKKGWVVDKTKIIQWGKWVLAHGLAWGLASWLAFEKPMADAWGIEIADHAAALVLVILAIYDSFRGRKKVHAE